MNSEFYRLELFFGTVFHEVILSEETQNSFIFGTVKGCNLRLPEENFSENFIIQVRYDENTAWSIKCSNNLRFADEHTQGEQVRKLNDSDGFAFELISDCKEICHGKLVRTFIRDEGELIRSIDLTNVQEFTIGGDSHCQIRVRDMALGAEGLKFRRELNGWLVSDTGFKLGYEINGNRSYGKNNLKNYDFISLCGYRFSINGDRLRFCKSPNISINGFEIMEHKDSRSNLEYPHLNRSTRLYYPMPDEPLKLQKPPSKSSNPDQNLLITVLPLIIMVALMVVMRFVIGSNGMYMIFMVASMGIGVCTSTYNYFHQKNKAAETEENRIKVYREYIEDKLQILENMRSNERTVAEKNTPNIERTVQSVLHFDRHIYERTPDQKDFAMARLGTGTVLSKCPVEYTPEEYRVTDDPLADWPEQICQRYEKIDDMPILLDLRNSSVIGIVGERDSVYETIKVMTIDLAAHHAPTELQLCYLLEPKSADSYAWVRWLPHCNPKPNIVRNIVTDEESCKHFIDCLYQIIVHRYENMRKGIQPIPHYVVFVLGDYELLKHPISTFFSQSAALGFSFVFCSCAAEALPQCNRLIRLNNNAGVIIEANDGNKTQLYHPAELADYLAHKVSRKMACITVDEAKAEQQLPSKLNLFKLLKIYRASELNYIEQWNNSSILDTLAAPIGINAKNEIIYLDVDEKSHGPHGLVAGTTGSGKSALLQTYILSMAIHYHPYEVGFVIIDFKGGGLANQLRDLPHMLGTITNIDSGEITRSLQSIQAELRKREHLFAQAGVTNINDYIRKYRANKVQIPLPHLILIVDEFAELRSEQPDFMKELISASRVGRSLGVHLILATQKPTGVVDEQIWSNSHFKLCLKVESEGDSKEVLKMPLAAEINNPGRAYLQVGNNEILELFQSAFSGAPSDEELHAGEHGYTVNHVSITGAKNTIFRHNIGYTPSNQTELQDVVSCIAECCEYNGIKRLNGICLEPLSSNLRLDTENFTEHTGEIITKVGIYDDPTNQIQAPFYINITAKNTMIIGSSQSGKTNFLMVLLRSLSSSYSPQDVQFYIIDFSSMVLKNFEKLPHVGGVVTAADDEKLRNLIKLLNEEIDKRKQILSTFGVSSFTAYREADMHDIPQIVLIVDNLTAIRETVFRDEDPLISICREGLSVGISMIVANPQTAAMGYKYLPNFACRIALYCNDPSEYSTMFGNGRVKNENIPGRCIVEQENKRYSCQLFCAFEGEREILRTQAIREFVDRINEDFKGNRAKQIPTIPETLLPDDLLAATDSVNNNCVIPIGLDYSTVAPVEVDFKRAVQIAVIDPTDTYKHDWIAYALNALNMSREGAIEVYVADGFDRKFSWLQTKSFVRRYSARAIDALAMVTDIEKELSERYKMLQNGEEHQNDDHLIVLLLDNYDAVESIASDLTSQSAYRNIIGKFKRMGICVLLSCIPNETTTFDAPEIIRKAKEYRQILFFGDASDLKFVELPIGTVKRFSGYMGKEEGFFIRGGNCIRIKCPSAGKT